MFGWDEAENAHRQAYGDNQGKLSHELLAGGAAFEGFKLFEDHQRKEGKQVNHAFAKEVLVGLVGAEADKLAESRGADFVDRERMKHDAKRNAERMYDEHYGQQGEYYDPNMPPPPHVGRHMGY